MCCKLFSSRLKSCRARVTPRSVASRKLVSGDRCNEGSDTAKFGADEQEVYKRQQKEDECPHQHDVQTQQSNVETSERCSLVVDTPAIEWRKMLLPGEVLE